MSLSATDLFLVGIGFDILGAGLLANGLLIPFVAIARLNTWAGLNTGDVVERCRNWRDAAFGVGYLILGFLSQAVGYGAVLDGGRSSSGSARAYTGVALCIATLACAYLLWAALRTRMLKWVIVKVVLAGNGSGKAGDEDRPGWTQTKAMRLLELGEEAGWAPQPSELEEGRAVEYGARVFGVHIPKRIYTS